MRLAAVLVGVAVYVTCAEAALRGRGGGFPAALERLAQVEEVKFERQQEQVAHNSSGEPEEDTSISGRVWRAAERARLPMMNAINVFRAQMCMSRPDLLKHKKCMKFMTKKCAKQTTGAGYCKKFQKRIVESCAEGSATSCEYAKDMGVKVGGGDSGGKSGAGALEGDTDGDGDVDANDKKALHGDTDGDGDVDAKDAKHGDVDGDGDVDAADAGDTDGDGDVDKHDALHGDVDGDGDVDKHNATTFDTDGDGDVDADDHAAAAGGAGGAAADGAAKAPAPAPGAPAPAGPAPGPAPGPLPVIDMDEKRPLPEQGYDEYHNASMVNHDDSVTMTGDWGTEWPEQDETEGQTQERICRDNPKLYWCRLYLKDRAGSLDRAGRSKEADIIADTLDSAGDSDN